MFYTLHTPLLDPCFHKKLFSVGRHRGYIASSEKNLVKTIIYVIIAQLNEKFGLVIFVSLIELVCSKGLFYGKFYGSDAGA